MTVTNIQKTEFALNPKKFALWLFIVSIIMIFASMTSAFIVKKSDGNWIIYDLPSALWISTGILLLSSASMHWAYQSAKFKKSNHVRYGLYITIILGIIFSYFQYLAWENLVDQKVFFAFANPGGSFFYVLTGLHVFHIITGLLYLLFTLIEAKDSNINSTNNSYLTKLEMCATYWHFLDVLWIYLFVFLFIYH